MDVHLIDGTYELFRHFFAVPSTTDSNGQEIGAVRGVLTSVLSMIEGGATHIGVATDHVVESFRNDLYPGYKTSEGVPPELLSQFPILEEALETMGVVVWPMVDYEADDALTALERPSACHKHLMLEHHMVAKRMGFLGALVFDSFRSSYCRWSKQRNEATSLR